MMMTEEQTPLERWLRRTGGNIDSLAADLGISRGRAYHYLKRTSLPRGPVLVELNRLTKMDVENFVPLHQLAKWDAMHKRRRARKKTA